MTRPAQFIDLTIDETAVRPKTVDLTNDETEFLDSTACLPSGKLRVEIPWISKLPMLDPSIRKKKVPPLRQQDNIIIADIRKAAEWFEQTEILFSGAMPQWGGSIRCHGKAADGLTNQFIPHHSRPHYRHQYLINYRLCVIMWRGGEMESCRRELLLV